MALKRKFNGKYYYFDSTFHNEDRAYFQAEELRKAGNLARVTKTNHITWIVWVRSSED